MMHKLIVKLDETFETYVGQVVTWGPDDVVLYAQTPGLDEPMLVTFPVDWIVEKAVLAA